MRFLKDAYLFVAEKPGKVPKAQISSSEYSEIKAPDGGFDVRIFKPGTSGRDRTIPIP